jgi:hypothetical protein
VVRDWCANINYQNAELNTHRLSSMVCKIYFLIFSGLPLRTHSIEQHPSWEANRLSASQEIPPISWKPKVYYRIRKCPPPVRILYQLDPVHTLTSHFLKIIAASRRSILLPQYVLLRNISFWSSVTTSKHVEWYATWVVTALAPCLKKEKNHRSTKEWCIGRPRYTHENLHDRLRPVTAAIATEILTCEKMASVV